MPNTHLSTRYPKEILVPMLKAAGATNIKTEYLVGKKIDSKWKHGLKVDVIADLPWKSRPIVIEAQEQNRTAYSRKTDIRNPSGILRCMNEFGAAFLGPAYGPGKFLGGNISGSGSQKPAFKAVVHLAAGIKYGFDFCIVFNGHNPDGSHCPESEEVMWRNMREYQACLRVLGCGSLSDMIVCYSQGGFASALLDRSL